MSTPVPPSAYSRCLRAQPYWLSTLRGFLPIQGNLPVSATEVDTIKAINEAYRDHDYKRAGDLTLEVIDREAARRDGPSIEISMLSRAANFYLIAAESDIALRIVTERLSCFAESPLRALVVGIINALNHRIAQGVEWLSRAVELDPDLGAAWASLAMIYGLDRDHIRAEAAARHAMRCGGQAHTRLLDLLLMQSTFEQGQPSEGAFDFNLGTADEPAVERLLAQLPPIASAEFRQPHNKPVVFVCVDHQYCLNYAVPLLLSIANSKTDFGVHLHVMNPGRGLASLLNRLRAEAPHLAIQVSTETVHAELYGEAKVYYSSIRFCRLYQFLQVNNNLAIQLDADALVRGDLATLPGIRNPQIDFGLVHLPGEPIWQEIAAGFSYFRATDASRGFLRDAAQFIAHNLLNGTARWYLDQVALYVAWGKHRNCARVELLDSATLDQQHTHDSLIWVITADKTSHARFIQAQQELLAAAPRVSGRPEEVHSREVVTTLSGHKMLIWSDDIYIGRSLKARGAWCHHELDMLNKFVKPGYTVVDAGANVGSHTLTFSQWVGPTGRVLAFEPQRLVFQLLMANLALNGIANTFAYQRGLGCQMKTLYVAPPLEPNNFGAVALSAEGPTANGEEVEVVALDSLNLDSCHLIKMDIEGMEWEAIQGAKHTIERHRPVLYLESHPRGRTFRDLLDAVRGLGYRAFDHGLNTNNPNLLCLPESFTGTDYGLKQVE